MSIAISTYFSRAQAIENHLDEKALIALSELARTDFLRQQGHDHRLRGGKELGHSDDGDVDQQGINRPQRLGAYLIEQLCIALHGTRVELESPLTHPV